MLNAVPAYISACRSEGSKSVLSYKQVAVAVLFGYAAIIPDLPGSERRAGPLPKANQPPNFLTAKIRHR